MNAPYSPNSADLLQEQPHSQPRVVLTVEAAAEVLSISRTRMFALIKTGAIQSIRIGRLRRIPSEALLTFVQELARTQPARADQQGRF
jgi:excisionase family DNA binding protein